MASYLDAATIVTASIAFVLYTQAGFGIGPAEMGLLSGLLTFGLAVGAAIGGRLSDRFGRRRVLFVDLLVFSLGLALLTFAPDVPWLIAGAAVAGLAMGADLPASISLAAEQGRVGQRGRLVGVTNLLWLCGIAATVVLANLVGWLGLSPEFGARVLFGHVLFVALFVWAGRLQVGESEEWLAQGEAPGTRATAAAAIRRMPPGALGRWAGALAATGLYYLLWNLQANTSGQFNAYLFTEVAGGSLATFNLIGLVTLPVGIAVAYLALRVLDTRFRMPAFVIAGALGALVLVLPAAGGISVPLLLPVLIAPALLAPFAGESLYKIWTQEIFPTSVRASAQGLTIFVSRLGTGVFALFTPLLATSQPRALFGLLLAASLASFLIGLLWVAPLAVRSSGEPGLHVEP